ncbi:MAG: serine/threonine protein kinase [Bacteroides sp.]|nr:serine/threonine protein kinase [Bacteroides sp.]
MAIIRLQGQKEKEAGIYYEVDSSSKTIGEGGMGRVYRGTCVNTRTGETRPVAIKFLYMDLPEQAIERARREASIHLRNDNLIEMLGFFETDEDRDGKIVKHYHVVSELLHGVSLADIIQGKATDPNGEEIPYARQLMNDFQKDPDHFAKTVIKSVLAGLMALHDAGYIHRDIDPSNIFITEDGKIKLIDFGICKQMKQLTTNDRQLTVAGAFMGKPEYASPELALGDLAHQNQTSDIYAMGVLLYQCLTGNVPFEGTRFDILDKQIKEKLPLQKISNKRLRDIITKATEKRQELRYQTAAEMRVDLESLDVRRAMSPAKKKAIILWSVIGVVVIIGAILGFVLYHQNVQRRAAELQEKNYVDSLQSVVRNEIAKGDSLTRIGLTHDEGYDEQLVNAKIAYTQAAGATSLLKKKNLSPDAKADAQLQSQCDAALKAAFAELTEKADAIAGDPDPEVAAEAEAFRTRADAVEKVMRK